MRKEKGPNRIAPLTTKQNETQSRVFIIKKIACTEYSSLLLSLFLSLAFYARLLYGAFLFATLYFSFSLSIWFSLWLSAESFFLDDALSLSLSVSLSLSFYPFLTLSYSGFSFYILATLMIQILAKYFYINFIMIMYFVLFWLEKPWWTKGEIKIGICLCDIKN